MLHDKENTWTNNPSFALITGGSSGIGLEFSKFLASKGYHILMVSNQEHALALQSEHIASTYSVNVDTLCMDLCQPDAAEKIFLYCETKNIEIDILINNAGVYFTGDILDTDPKKIENTLHLHCISVSLLCHYFGKKMQERKKGYILNMSSLAAWMPYPKIALYAASKRYIKDFSRAIRTELLPYGVSVTAITPGAVNTDLLNLSPSARKIAVKTGIMMCPVKLAKKALKAMFRRKAGLTPGILNCIGIPVLIITPLRLISCIQKKFGRVFQS